MIKSCYNCFNFKIVPYTDTATCKLGLLTKHTGEKKYYRSVFSTDNHKRVKSLQIKAKGCEYYDG